MFVISAVSPEGELFFEIRESHFLGSDIVNFLKALLAFFGKKLLVIWDGAAIHRDENVKNFLKQEEESGENRVFWARLPPYCPEPDADEQVWQTVKDDMLKNVICKNIPELKIKVSGALNRLKRDKDKIKSYFFYPDVMFY